MQYVSLVVWRTGLHSSILVCSALPGIEECEWTAYTRGSFVATDNVFTQSPYSADNQLDVVDLCCERGFHQLFRNMGFSLQAGQALQVKGANGSGKTSLLRIVCGLSLPESGCVNWNHQSIRSSAPEYRAQLGYLGHRNGLKGELTPMENLAAQLSIGAVRELSPADKINANLSLAGIHQRHDRACRSLSAGQQRRVAIARLMMANAALWILDEPATALDSTGISFLQKAMQRHLDQRGMILFTSHQQLAFAGEQLMQVSLDGAVND